MLRWACARWAGAVWCNLDSRHFLLCQPCWTACALPLVALERAKCALPSATLAADKDNPTTIGLLNLLPKNPEISCHARGESNAEIAGLKVDYKKNKNIHTLAGGGRLEPKVPGRARAWHVTRRAARERRAVLAALVRARKAGRVAAAGAELRERGREAVAGVEPARLSCLWRRGRRRHVFITVRVHVPPPGLLLARVVDGCGSSRRVVRRPPRERGARRGDDNTHRVSQSARAAAACVSRALSTVLQAPLSERFTASRARLSFDRSSRVPALRSDSETPV